MPKVIIGQDVVEQQLKAKFPSLCFLLLCVQIRLFMNTPIHVCMHVHVCVKSRGFLNCSPPFSGDKVSLTGPKFAYLAGLTVVSARDPLALLHRAGIARLPPHPAFYMVFWIELGSLLVQQIF